MLNLQLLEQLIAFADEGTLSKVAEVLLISQPSLTRNMQLLEEELGVQLFLRSKNKLILTETGEYTVRQARTLLRQGQAFQENIQRFSLQSTTLFGGICTPSIEWELEARLAEQDVRPKMKLELTSNEELNTALLQETYQFIVTDYPLQQAGVLSSGFFMEQLYLSVPRDHALAHQETITLADLAGLTILLRSDLGVWESLVHGLTETTFIVQKDWEAYEQLVSASELPSFSTNMTQSTSEEIDQRVQIPISDKEATKTFYLSVLQKNKAILSQFTATR